MTTRQWTALAMLVLGFATASMARGVPQSLDPAQEVAMVQVSLTVLGYQPGPIDGLGGRRTVAALAAYAKDRGVVLNQATVNLVVALLHVETRQEILTPGEEEEGQPFTGVESTIPPLQWK